MQPDDTRQDSPTTALPAPRSDDEAMKAAAAELLANELLGATTALREARRERDEARRELDELALSIGYGERPEGQGHVIRATGQEIAEAFKRACRERDEAEPSEELQVAQEKAASLHAQVQELVERNTALEQEVCDLKAGALTHSAEAQDDVLREAERWRLAAEALQRNLQAREEEMARRGMELLRHQALVESFARELGEAMLKRALEVRT